MKDKNEDKMTLREFVEKFSTQIEISIIFIGVGFLVIIALVFTLFSSAWEQSRLEHRMAECVNNEVFTREECLGIIGND